MTESSGSSADENAFNNGSGSSPYAPPIQGFLLLFSTIQAKYCLDTNQLLGRSQPKSKNPLILQTGPCLYEGVGRYYRSIDPSRHLWPNHAIGAAPR
jgi:hypothetical protein